MYYDDINVTKRKTITNGEKYDFFVYNLLPLEKEFSKGKFGKGDTVTSSNREMLDVKIRCSKKIDDAMESPIPEEAEKVFEKCLEELINRGLERG